MNNDANNPESTLPEGGRGEVLSHNDRVLLSRAIRDKWPIPHDMRVELTEQVWTMIRESKKERVRMMGAKLLVDMNKQNLEIDLALDKYDRIDQGKDTESMGVRFEKVIKGPTGEGV